MKRVVLWILILILVSYSKNIFAGVWKVQDSGTTEDLTSVHFVDKNNGWVVGTSEIILHTNNGGETWKIQRKNEGRKDHIFHDIHFVNKNVGWVTGGYKLGDDARSFIRYTQNGGDIWSVQRCVEDEIFYSIHFVNTKEGWVVGGKKFGEDFKGIILHTNNGGNTWGTQTVTATGYLFDIQFLNENNGYAVGSIEENKTLKGIILSTQNGGVDWNIEKKIEYGMLFDIHFINQDNGWIIGNSWITGEIVLHTSNGGITWGTQSTNITTWIRSAHFLDSNNGWIVGGGGVVVGGGVIFHSSNGGKSWNVERTIDNGKEIKALYDVFFVDEDNGWIVGEDGLILKYVKIPIKLWEVTVYPNPFKPSLNHKVITFGHPTDVTKRLTEYATIKIYTIAGELVKTIEVTPNNGGIATWDTRNDASKLVASGIYIYCIINPGGEKCTGKIGIVR